MRPYRHGRRTIAPGAGVVLPLLNQTILLWQVALGSLFHGQRYSPIQLFGIFLVVGGVAKAAWPSGAGGSILGQVMTILPLA